MYEGKLCHLSKLINRGQRLHVKFREILLVLSYDIILLRSITASKEKGVLYNNVLLHLKDS